MTVDFFTHKLRRRKQISGPDGITERLENRSQHLPNLISHLRHGALYRFHGARSGFRLLVEFPYIGLAGADFLIRGIRSRYEELNRIASSLNFLGYRLNFFGRGLLPAASAS